jgi:hypothetical protein
VFFIFATPERRASGACLSLFRPKKLYDPFSGQAFNSIVDLDKVCLWEIVPADAGSGGGELLPRQGTPARSQLWEGLRSLPVVCTKGLKSAGGHRSGPKHPVWRPLPQQVRRKK